MMNELLLLQKDVKILDRANGAKITFSHKNILTSLRPHNFHLTWLQASTGVLVIP